MRPHIDPFVRIQENACAQHIGSIFNQLPCRNAGGPRLDLQREI